MSAKYIFLFRTRARRPRPLPKPFLSYTRSRKLSSSRFSTEIQPLENSFTVAYLINSCGLSPESAILASRRVKFEAPHKSDSVLKFLRSHGFTEAQISKIAKHRPELLVASPEKTLLPKLNFFESIGVSEADLPHMLASASYILSMSLNNRIIPFCNHLKNLLGSDKEVIAALRRPWSLFWQAHSEHLLPNINLLTEIGVPNSFIVLSLKHFPEALTLSNDEFVQIVQQIEAMGFDPKKSNFVGAVRAIGGRNKVIWEQCYEIYTNKWGWSKDEIMMAFRKNPTCMISSEKKIMQVMQYLVGEMGRPANLMAKCPNMLLFSLEKRIKPRCLVVKVLHEKGVMNRDSVSLTSLLCSAESYFLKKYIHKYLEQLPELLRVYEGQVGASNV